MSRWINLDAYDSYFAYLQECNRQDIVSDLTTPTDLTNTLSHTTMEAGDYSIESGNTGGKKLVIGEKIGVDVTNDGTTRYAVLSKDGEIRLVTPCNEREVSATLGDRINMGEYHLDVSAPEAVV